MGRSKKRKSKPHKRGKGNKRKAGKNGRQCTEEPQSDATNQSVSAPHAEDKQRREGSSESGGFVLEDAAMWSRSSRVQIPCPEEPYFDARTGRVVGGRRYIKMHLVDENTLKFVLR